MHRIFLLLLITLFFTNCSHKIVRTGYDAEKSDYTNCDVVIKKDTIISDSIATKIGHIKLGETGFSVKCNEEDAIAILKNEACAIAADLIIITDEKRPDAWSSCYRCTADFYQYNDSITNDTIVVSDILYNDVEIQERISDDKRRNTAMLITSVLIGFIIGLTLL